MAYLELFNFRGVLLVKLRLQIVVRVEHSLHVLVCLPLGLQQSLLSSVELVLESLDLVLQLGSFSCEEVLILRKHVYFSPERLASPLDLVLAFLDLVDLCFKNLRLLLIVLLVDLKLPDLLEVILLLDLCDVRALDLLVEHLVVGLQLLVPPLERIDPPMRVKPQVLELLRHVVLLHPFPFQLRLVLQQLRSCLLVVVSLPVQVPQVRLQRLVDLDLHELFEALVLLHLQLYVGLLGDQQLMCRQLLLVQLQLLLERRQLVDHLLLGVLQLFDYLGTSLLLLLECELEVLALGLQDLGQLLLLEPHLLDLPFHGIELLGEAGLLALNFTEERAIELLESCRVVGTVGVLVPASWPVGTGANLRRVHVVAEGRGTSQAHRLVLVVRMR